MQPASVILTGLGPENRRLVRNAIQQLGWSVLDMPDGAVARPITPEGGIEVLATGAPGPGEPPPAIDRPTLWIVPPEGIVPRTAGRGPHEFIRMPAPGEEIAARLAALVLAERRERDLRRAERETAHHLDRRRGLVASVAHGIASPMSAVLEYIEMLADRSVGRLTPAQEEIVARARDAGRALAERLDEIVDAANAEAGSPLEMERVETPLRPVLQELQAWAVPRLRGKAQSLAMQLAPGAPAVCCDPGRLAQALRHLVDNACRHTPAGGRIEIDVARDPDATGFVRITVADDGPGIPAVEHGRLFDPFAGAARDDPDASPAEIGLVLAQAIATGAGGMMKVEDCEGRGTAISLSLPIWGSRAARIAQAQGLICAAPRASWVCRRCGPGSAEDPWFLLSPGEALLISEVPRAGVEVIGRVRDLRPPGSLARALQPRLTVHAAPRIEEGEGE